MNQEVVESVIHENPIKEVLSTSVNAAIMEELVFRGLSFRTLLHRNQFGAYAFNFIIFGLVHLEIGFVSGSGFSEFVFLPLYGFSEIVLAYAYKRSECNYSLIILTDFINNFISVILILSI